MSGEVDGLSEHVIDCDGQIWRIVRDGGMATRAHQTGIVSIGIAALDRVSGPLVTLAAYAAAERDRAVAEALAPVRALHTPDPSGDWCDHCWTGPDAHGNGPSPEWPCATIRALRAALPAETGGEGT